MANADALYEICKELCLLSQLSSKIFDKETLRNRADLASLYYGLRALSDQAKQVITEQFSDYHGALNEKPYDFIGEQDRKEGQNLDGNILARRSLDQHGWIGPVAV